MVVRLPELVAENGHRRTGGWLVLVRREPSSDDGPGVEKGKETRADGTDASLDCLVPHPDREGVVPERTDVIEGARLLRYLREALVALVASRELLATELRGEVES